VPNLFIEEARRAEHHWRTMLGRFVGLNRVEIDHHVRLQPRTNVMRERQEYIRTNVVGKLGIRIPNVEVVINKRPREEASRLENV
jgi:hypothetical protein